MSFDQFSERYEDAVDAAIGACGGSHAGFTLGKARRLVDLAGGVGQLNDMSVLDVGCGVGSTDAYLVDDFGSVIGVDIAPAVLDEAARRNHGVEYRLSPDPPALPVADGEVDVAFASCVFHHVPADERRALASEMVRAVRPGGLVAIFEHNPLNPATRRVVSRCEFDEDAVLLRRAESEDILTAAGVDLVASAYLFFWPWPKDSVQRVERHLEWLPFGAQYVVAGVSRAAS
jgi:SAM-dependent methyltransferase